jgi:hypothetical protein
LPFGEDFYEKNNIEPECFETAQAMFRKLGTQPDGQALRDGADRISDILLLIDFALEIQQFRPFLCFLRVLIDFSVEKQFEFCRSSIQEKLKKAKDRSELAESKKDQDRLAGMAADRDLLAHFKKTRCEFCKIPRQVAESLSYCRENYCNPAAHSNFTCYC